MSSDPTPLVVVRRTAISEGVEVVTIQSDDNAYCCRPFLVYALTNGIRSHVTDNVTEAAALMPRDRLVDAKMRQHGEGRHMPTAASVRRRRRER